jgi:transposase
MRQPVKPRYRLRDGGGEMGKSRRIFDAEFKRAAVNELKSGKPIGLVARQLEVHSNTLNRWRRELEDHPTKAFPGRGKRMLEESRESELERKVGQMTMEIDFLKKLVRSLEELRETGNGGGPFTRKSTKKTKR